MARRFIIQVLCYWASSSGGSARTDFEVSFSEGKMGFSIPPQWEESNNDLSVEGMQGDSLSGHNDPPMVKVYLERCKSSVAWDKRNLFGEACSYWIAITLMAGGMQREQIINPVGNGCFKSSHSDQPGNRQNALPTLKLAHWISLSQREQRLP